MSVSELEKAVAALSQPELQEFREWFANFDMAQWDRQIESDSAAGKLDGMIAEALGEYRAGRSTEI